jgi:hypothetical protein
MVWCPASAYSNEGEMVAMDYFHYWHFTGFNKKERLNEKSTNY